MENIFLDIGIIIIIAGSGAYIARALRQPLIPAYIIVGIILGPVLGVFTDKTIITPLAEIGIAFLLFSVGLELNLKKLRDVGKVATIGALLHMGLLFGVSYAAFKLLKYNDLTSVYIGLILMFSSTFVLVKLLSDKNSLDTLHGRIIIGMLLMQDIVAIIALGMLNSIGQPMLSSVLWMFIQGFLVFLIGLAMARIVFTSVFKFAARHEELLFLLSIMIMFFFAIIYSLIGFSIIIGAFIAGLLLGSLPYNLEIIGQVKGIKDFFAVIFFVSIGLELIPVSISKIALPLGVMLGITLILLPIMTLFLLGLFGYKKRTAFLTSISLAQISEFSLIIVAIGFNSGHISAEIFSLTILVAIITIGLTSYIIKFDDKLYQWFGRKLVFFDKLSKHNKELISYLEEGAQHKVVLVGYDRIGYSILQKLNMLKKNVVVIDLNPDMIKHLIKKKVPCIYGDIGDVEIIKRLRLEEAELVISTVPSHQDSMLFIKKVRELNPEATIIVTSYDAEDALELYKKGADYVVVPHFLGGEHISLILEELTTDLNKLLKIKINHMKALQERRRRHPHHR
ncbi:cation:proton antiporter [Candidatus Woesearchaeota archaeon]|nr:cation:proton antiporter [Candidatus Woesearchaeota archaeon]